MLYLTLYTLSGHVSFHPSGASNTRTSGTIPLLDPKWAFCVFLLPILAINPVRQRRQTTYVVGLFSEHDFHPAGSSQRLRRQRAYSLRQSTCRPGHRSLSDFQLHRPGGRPVRDLRSGSSTRDSASPDSGQASCTDASKSLIGPQNAERKELAVETRTTTD